MMDFDRPALDWNVTAFPVTPAMNGVAGEPDLAPAPVVTELAIPAHILKALMTAADVQPDLEICCPYGGVVVPGGTLVVLDVTGPGEHSNRAWASCDYDPPAVQGWLDTKHSLMPYFNIGGTIHTHPGSSFASGQDVESFAAWITDPEHNPDGNRYAAVYGIVGRDGNGRVNDMRAYYVDESALDPVHMPWRVLDAADPVYLAAIDFAVDGVWRGPDVVLPADCGFASEPSPRESGTIDTAPTMNAVLDLAWHLAQVGLDLVVEGKTSGLQHWLVCDGGRTVLTGVYSEGPKSLLLFAGDRVTRDARLAAIGYPDAASAVTALATSARARRAAHRDANRLAANRDGSGFPQAALRLG